MLRAETVSVRNSPKKIDQQKLDFLPTSLLAWNILESVETSVSAILKENETIFISRWRFPEMRLPPVLIHLLGWILETRHGFFFQ